jgi:Rps23 Pro-64 3,4-dihydroxylase Tpa1-like proline 4-hydroxylase
MKPNLTVDGYYVGRLDELTFNRVEFEDDITFIKSLYENKNKHYRYRHSCDHYDVGRLADIVGPLPHQISMEQKEQRIHLVKEHKINVWQQWGELIQNYEINPITPTEGTETLERIKADKITNVVYNFRKIWLNNFSKLYPELDVDKLRISDSITLYENGDFINWHTDGNGNPNDELRRVCVILMYLSDESEYNDGGGKFLVERKLKDTVTTTQPEQYIEVLPLKENFVVLDFRNNNLKHAVEEVKNNFKRYCYIAFVHTTV